ncbi:Clp protease N-terminal domain-containing protein [Amycolatopsis suaedae]|uniref:ATP-dependent Clp protease ATP-binding subunit n=1 Tax=Amycolatopsis suaedae TaxID=2510978 RepID=A0A4V2EKX6_9PSEU|nr:Clp protease N-terminal domain-containing protein [Amycolatopsis suaedae]RZQ59595.1 ATP-dependent Clp protease ATP-binding subunit [Amycolatopsis suaedae]
MPKINVYLPDELAESVRETGVPVSAICQRALEQSVRRVTAIRAATFGELGEDPTASLTHFTERTRTVLRTAIERARSEIGTEHLLAALLDEGTNLALHVLRAVEIEPDLVARKLEPEMGDDGPRRFDQHAAAALELAVTEALSLGHNYVGCEHLLLGLLAEPDGRAGMVLRALGADLRSVRRAVVAALSGYVHLRAQQADPIAAVVREELKPIIERIERLEQQA